MNKREQFTRALVAGVLDFPALAYDEPSVAKLRPQDFGGEWGGVWEVIQKQASNGGVALPELVQALDRRSGFDLSFFNHLRATHGGQPVADIITYAEELRRIARRERIYRIGQSITLAAQTDQEPEAVAMRAMDELHQEIMQFPDRSVKLADIMSVIYDEVVARSQNPSEVWGIPYGFTKLDFVTGGQHAEEMTLLGGEPGVGKTWMAAQIAVQAANHQPGVVFSFEMSDKSIGRRMLQLFGAPGRRMKTGYMRPEDWDALSDAMAALEGRQIILDVRSQTLPEIRAALARHQAKDGVRWFVLDYLMRVKQEASDATEKSAIISAALKDICRDLKIPGLVVSSVTKSGMDREGSSAKSMMRGAGDVIHDADNILLLTKFYEVDKSDAWILPGERDNIRTLTIDKGREMERVGAAIHYRRVEGSPRFEEYDASARPAQRPR